MVETSAMLEVRPEAERDHDAMRRVHEHAFTPSPEQARLLDALRFASDLAPELCLVAEDGGEVVVVGSRVLLPVSASSPGGVRRGGSVRLAAGGVDGYLLPAYTPEPRGRVSYAGAFSLGG
jgi:hypothetical protein